jgi:hypothetical protein
MIQGTVADGRVDVRHEPPGLGLMPPAPEPQQHVLHDLLGHIRRANVRLGEYAQRAVVRLDDPLERALG